MAKSKAKILREEKAKINYVSLMECYPFTLDAIDDEIWRPINDDYHVSNYGRVKSFKAKKPIILKPLLQGEYLQVALSMDGKPKSFYVHILVAQVFIPNVDNKPEVNHVFGNKFDNYVGNLEWATSAENKQHASKTGLLKSGTEHWNTKLKDENIILYIRENPDSLTGRQLAAMFGMSEGHISEIQLGKKWGHVGGTVRSKIDTRIPDEKRAAIRADAATGQYSLKQLAEMYNVCQATISNIINEDKK